MINNNEILSNYSALVVEATYNVDEIGSYYWYKNKPNAHFAFNFQLCFLNDKLYTKNEQKSKLKKTFNPLYLQHLITDYVKHLPRDSWSNWQLGNHDQPRIASRIGKENINLANALYLLLGGTAVTYYGEEIGMENLPKEHLKFEDCQDESGKRHGVNNSIKISCYSFNLQNNMILAQRVSRIHQRLSENPDAMGLVQKRRLLSCQQDLVAS